MKKIFLTRRENRIKYTEKMEYYYRVAAGNFTNAFLDIFIKKIVIKFS